MTEVPEDNAHWAHGSNKEPVREGVREVSQDPDLFADEDDDDTETEGDS